MRWEVADCGASSLPTSLHLDTCKVAPFQGASPRFSLCPPATCLLNSFSLPLRVPKSGEGGGGRPSFPLPSLLFRPSLSLRLRDRSPRYDGDLSLSPSPPEFPLSPLLEGHSSQAPPFFLSSSSLLLSYDDVVESEGEGAKGRIQRVNQAPLQHSRCRQPTVFLLPPSQTVVEV